MVLFAALSIHSILLVCSKKDGAYFLLFSESRISGLRISSHFDGECVPADFEEWERRSHRNGLLPGLLGYGYPWIYPCVDMRLRPGCGYIHGYYAGTTL